MGASCCKSEEFARNGGVPNAFAEVHTDLATPIFDEDVVSAPETISNLLVRPRVESGSNSSSAPEGSRVSFREVLKGLPRKTDKVQPQDLSEEISTIFQSGENSTTFQSGDIHSSFASDTITHERDKAEVSGELGELPSYVHGALGTSISSIERAADADDSDDDSETTEGFELDSINYGDAKFWKEVYSGMRSREHIPQDWLLTYDHFKAKGWHKYLRGGSILELGCGDSEFMSSAYDDGFDDITSTDIDPGVIETMRQNNAALRPGVRYMQNDACDMRKIADKSFDIAFDKGVMDALICNGKSVTSRCSREVHRVLKDSGLYLCVSLNEPEQMKAAISRTGCLSRQWDVKVLSCDNFDSAEECDHQVLYMYVCRKIQVKLR